MALFQTSVLKTYLSQQDHSLIERAYKKYIKYFHNPVIQENIKNSKEEQYQAKFLDELFVNILDYTLNPKPNFNITTEFKNQKGAGKADGAILKNNTAVGVIELKGTNTKDLESIRKQAFDYKANQKGCVYVVTSNFEKLRFYINDATEFLEFNLFQLAPEEFALLYLCLQKDNILNNLPLTIKEASLVEEDKITKQFYNDYSVFKRELYRDLVKRNAKRLKQNVAGSGTVDDTDELKALEKNVKLSLFKKSQKLIDRFLFIFFAEDRDLLPPNSTIQILDKWKADIDFGDERPLYNLFKQYFYFLDEGRKGTASRAEIYAYNGGLFKPDNILDDLEIDDALLYKHTYKLAKYDFSSQVDVNILGHIFENSLNEIESVNAEIEGGAFDKQKSKRKKDGVFYTPKYITKYIVENTVGKLCQEKKEALGFKEEAYFELKKGTHQNTKIQLLDVLDTYRAWLLQITICDPACGSGAFLNQALDFLIKEHRYIDELKAKVLGGGLILSDIENTILENNIYGVDLNEESVEIAKLSLWLRTAQPRRKLNDLSSNIKCGNSLIDSKAVAGDKAFNWETEFPKVFKAKDTRAFHITTSIHDSRTSERMVKYKARERRDNGTNPYPNVIYFTPEGDLLITQTIAEIVKEDSLKVLAYNICADHIHLLLVCEEAEIPGIMQKVKGRTSFVVGRSMEVPKGLKPLGIEDKTPLSKEIEPIEIGETTQNEKHKPFWSQKYYTKPVETQAHLATAIAYIEHNRSKHELPQHSRAINDIIDGFCTTLDDAFKDQSKGGFDVVIGNPPYAGRSSSINEIEKKYVKQMYSTSEGKFELYQLFIEKCLSLAKPKNSYIALITPQTWLSIIQATKLRKLVLSNNELSEIVFLGKNVFEDASVDSIVFIISLGISNKNIDFLLSRALLNESTNILKIDYDKIEKKTFTVPISSDKDSTKVVLKANTDSITLESIGKWSDGVKVVGPAKLFAFQNIKVDESFSPMLLGKDIDRYILEWSGLYCCRDKAKIESHKATDIRLREESMFLRPKILIRKTGNQIVATLDRSNYFHEQSLFSFGIEDDKFQLNSLLAILNSKLANFLLRENAFSRKETFPQIRLHWLKEFPIPASLNSVELENSVDKIQDKFFLFNQSIKQFVKYLESQVSNLSTNKKLENWHELDFSDFINELNKAIKKEGGTALTKKDEFEWLELFEDNKKKAQTLQTQITQTEKEIDTMVYQLYGLTDDEIQIVENS
ncbi:TaqI-like C-terminal specificity domain-containing protein [Mariniflexile soesokkakense]|uniref:site-specific DNA-methyltransferase (adenine-specific) n=1 Tax=Mariniflexile soesokkakense TaxID=1343160 RepID=A0ABV0AD97_9FLAO